jgi:hypothetical protein
MKWTKHIEDGKNDKGLPNMQEMWKVNWTAHTSGELSSMTEYELLYVDKRCMIDNTSILYKTEIEAVDSIEKSTCAWVGYGSYSPHCNHIFIVKEYEEDYESSIGKEISRYNQDGVKI